MQTLPLLVILAGVLVLGGGCQQKAATSLAMQQKFFSSLRQSNPEAEKPLRIAQYYMLVGRFDLALQELQRAANKDPDDIRLLNAMGNCHDRQGNHAKAQENYQKILAREPDHPLALNNLGYSYYLAGDLNRAEATFQEVLAKHPGNNLARNNLGLLWCRQGKEKQALSLWQKTDGDLAAQEKLHQVASYLGKPIENQLKPGPSSQDLASLTGRPRATTGDLPDKDTRLKETARAEKLAPVAKPSAPDEEPAPPTIARSQKAAAEPAKLSQKPPVQVEEVEMVIRPASYSPPSPVVGQPAPLPAASPDLAAPRSNPGNAKPPLTRQFYIPDNVSQNEAETSDHPGQVRTWRRSPRPKMVVYTPEPPQKSLKEYISKGYSLKKFNDNQRSEAAVF